MIHLEINLISFIVKNTLSVLEACKYIGYTIPRFCYYEGLSIAGNCRLCLVEIGNSPKPVASCALPVLNNMRIFLDTPLVKKARENVLELLLLNHPLDCPICDQGGECDLQDQAVYYGFKHSRYFYNKRSVEDKLFHPSVKTIMTRCIHCTRCVRYSSEILGIEILGTINRGVSMEISPYIPTFQSSELLGNIIDLCPVGALTSKIYAFRGRPWELKLVESIDLTDSLGSVIYVYFKELEIVRILPKITLNTNLISDKARYFFDALNSDRLVNLYYQRSPKNLQTSNWNHFLKYLNLTLGQRTIFLINSELDLETMILYKKLQYKYKQICQVFSTDGFISNKKYFFFRANNFEKAKTIFLIGTNLKLECALLNSKIRQKFYLKHTKIFVAGHYTNLNYPTNFINLNLQYFINILEGFNFKISRFLLKSFSHCFIIGEALYKRGFDIDFLYNFILKYNTSINIINLYIQANSQGLLYTNIPCINKAKLNNVVNLFSINLVENFLLYKVIKTQAQNCFWFNTHGSSLLKYFKWFIPVLSAYEEESLFLNLENKPQKTLKIFNGIHHAKSLRKIFQFFLNIPLINTFNYFLFETILNCSMILHPKKFFFTSLKVCDSTFVSLYPVKLEYFDYYQTFRLSKYSKNMLLYSKHQKLISSVF